jgi:hypothetical protein
MHAIHTRETGLLFLLLGLLAHVALKKLPATPWARRPARVVRDFFLNVGVYLLLDSFLVSR